MAQDDLLPSQSPDFMRTAALADAYGLLALMTQFPTEEVVAGLADGSIAQDARAILLEAGARADDPRFVGMLANLGEAGERAGDAEALTHLRREYTRLFNHPEAPALGIFEELFLHIRKRRLEDAHYVRDREREPRTFVNNASFDAERLYKAAGFVRLGVTNNPSDCMFVEMQFVGCLFERLAKAKLEGIPDLNAQTIGHIAEFKRLHLDKWMKPFYEDCAIESREPFLRAVGAIGGITYDLTCDYLA